MSSFRLVGSATIRTANDISAQLSAALAEGGEVLIDCTGVEEADITLLQLLVASARSAAAAKVALRLAPPPPPWFQALVERAGIALPDGLIPA